MHDHINIIRTLADDLDRLPADLRPAADAFIDERIGFDLDMIAGIIGAAVTGDADELIANAPEVVR